jgi:preprotein translocase subunit SecD
VRIEFRLAEDSRREGLSEVQHQGHPSKLYVQSEVIVANPEIDSAKAVRDDLGRPAVRLTLTEDGLKKLSVVAAANKMKRLAILVDGKALLAPVIEGPIDTREVMITGALTEAETERIALAFARK